MFKAFTSPHSPKSPAGTSGARLLMAASGIALLLSLGTLNGGTLGTSSWDTFVTALNGILQSSYVQAIGLIVLVVGVWMAKTGKGWTVLEWLVVLLVIAYIAPKIFTSTATSTRSLEEVGRADAAARAEQTLVNTDSVTGVDASLAVRVAR